MGLDSVPAPTSFPHLFTLQSTGDSLEGKGKSWVTITAPSIPAARRGWAHGHGHGPTVGQSGEFLWVGEAAPARSLGVIRGSVRHKSHRGSPVMQPGGVSRGMASRHGNVCSASELATFPKQGLSHQPVGYTPLPHPWLLSASQQSCRHGWVLLGAPWGCFTLCGAETPPVLQWSLSVTHRCSAHLP